MMEMDGGGWLTGASGRPGGMHLRGGREGSALMALPTLAPPQLRIEFQEESCKLPSGFQRVLPTNWACYFLTSLTSLTSLTYLSGALGNTWDLR